MTSHRSSRGQIFTVYIIGTVLGCAACGSPQHSQRAPGELISTQTIAERYRLSASETERRDLALQAIDQGLLRRGVAKQRLVELFGADADVDPSYFNEPLAMHYAIVRFSDTSSAAPHIAASDEGWHMIVYLIDDTIYSLQLRNTTSSAEEVGALDAQRRRGKAGGHQPVRGAAACERSVSGRR